MKDAPKKISSETLKKLLGLVKLHTGITMEDRKFDLLMTRLRPRIRELNLEGIEKYVEYLEANAKSEKQEFIDLVTTNETHFFRTEAVWKFFNENFLPQWLKTKNTQSATLRVWSAAASTGAEAYSISMLCEEIKTRNPHFRYQVSASDISSDVIKTAQTGVYKGKMVEECKTRRPELFQKHFQVVSPQEAKISDNIKKNVEFSFHNLQQRSSRRGFYDIVFLRNVLIYFSEPDQETVLRHIHESLCDGGYLIIGESESLSRLKTDFTYHEPLIYQKKAG